MNPAAKAVNIKEENQMKKLMAMILCLMLVLTTAAFAQEANTELKAHLRVLYPGTSDLEYEIADDIAAVMAEKYPNIEVEFMFLSWADMELKMASMVQIQDYPDVTQIQDIANAVAMNALEPIQPWIEKSEMFTMDNFNAAGIAKMSIDGTLYAVPMSLIPYSHIYNAELFEQAGVDAAAIKTWADVVDAAKKISELGEGYYGFAMANGGEGRFAFRDFMMMALTNGIDPSNTSDEAKQAYIETLQLVADLAPYMPDSCSTWLYPDLYKAWETGKIGMMHTGGYYTANAVPHGINNMNFTHLLTLPAGPSAEKSAAMIGGNAYAMFAGSTQKEAAWAFIEVAMSPEIVGKLCGSMNAAAVDYIAEDILVEWADKAYASYGENVGAQHVALIAEFQAAANEVGIPMPTITGQSAMEKVVQGALVKLINGEITVEAAYDEIKAGIEEVKASL